MLTSDLLRIKRSQGKLEPRYLMPAGQKKLLPCAEALIAIVKDNIGQPRDVVDTALETIPTSARDRLVVLGLRKLLLDRCDFATADGLSPADVRQSVFLLAAAHRRELEAREPFDRDAVLTAAATELKATSESLEDRLFADLKAREQLLSFKSIDAQQLLERYDVALAQGVLIRASSVQVTLEKEAPGRARQLFRAARFRGLLHRVMDLDDGRYVIEMDGPFSLFSSVNKYGLELALFLPAILRCKRWKLQAEILWGKGKERHVFELGPESKLVPHQKRITGVSPQLNKFVDQFRKLKSSWEVRENDVVVALPGEQVCVPDLIFSNTKTGEEVFLEAFGFWSRKAVWDRIETIRGGFPSRIILAVGKQLRVSKDALEDADCPSGAAQLYVYKGSIRPRSILERLDTTDKPTA